VKADKTPAASSEPSSQVPVPTPTAVPSSATPAPVTTGTPSAIQTQSGAPRNLTVTATVRQQLITAYETGKKLPSNGVTGTRPGSVYYALDPATGIHWAYANFDPSRTLTLQQSVSFQDGGSTGEFRQAPNSGWQFLGSVGQPSHCPGLVPANVRRVWALPSGSSCGTE
jgi:hypothetical protein